MSNTKQITDVLAPLPAISLQELLAEAEFLTRQDRKYVLAVDQARRVFARVEGSLRVLEIDGQRDFGYLTPYFDDSQYSAYLGAARRRPNRFKVRSRLYVESGLRMLEVKVRDARGRTVKHRMGQDAPVLETLTSSGRDWLASFPQVAPHARDLRHCMTTEYRRTTLALPGGAGRVTIDTDLRFTSPDGSSIEFPDWVIVETKGAGGPTTIDRLLWRCGSRPSPMSKFTAGLSLLVPDLPANRWHRTRRTLLSASSVFRESIEAGSGASPMFVLAPSGVLTPAPAGLD